MSFVGVFTAMALTSQQFYTVLSFKWWDGYAVYVDPVFVSYISHGVGDTSGPSITSVSHDPLIPTATDVVTVSANVEDISGVSYTTLQYKIGSGDWTNVTMTSSGDTWSGDIPSQTDSTLVTYRIVAADDIGNEAISGEFTYTVGETPTTTTTTTTTTTGTSPPPLDDGTMMLLIGGFGVVLLVIVIVGIRRRK